MQRSNSWKSSHMSANSISKMVTIGTVRHAAPDFTDDGCCCCRCADEAACFFVDRTQLGLAAAFLLGGCPGVTLEDTECERFDGGVPSGTGDDDTMRAELGDGAFDRGSGRPKPLRGGGVAHTVDCVLFCLRRSVLTIGMSRASGSPSEPSLSQEEDRLMSPEGAALSDTRGSVPPITKARWSWRRLVERALRITHTQD